MMMINRAVVAIALVVSILQGCSQEKREPKPVSEATFPVIKWNLYVHDANEATLISPYGSPEREVMRVDIKKAGTQPNWHIQLNQGAQKVDSHHRYRLSFRGRADGPRNVSLGFAMAHAPWTFLGLYKSLVLNPEWQSFQEDFVVPADDNNAKILFDLGGNSISAEFSDIKLYHIGKE